MIEILSLILSLIFVTLSMLGYGLIINKSNKNHDLFFIILVGYFFLGFSSLILHFFVPITNLISIVFLIIGIFFFIKGIKNLNNFKIIKKLIIFSLICFLLISFSEHPIDANMYHHSYISYLNTEKIIFGVAQVQFRFGHISFLQYVQAIISNDFLHELTISAPNLILYSFFIFFCSDIILKNFKKRILFLITILISSFILIKFYRYREYGNDLIPFILASYLLINIIKNSFYSGTNNSKIINLLPIYSILIFAHKISYLFSALIGLILIKKKEDLFKLFKSKSLLIVFLIFLFSWIAKNIITTSCLAYPLVISCIENTSWYLSGIADPKNASWLTELWAKDFITNENWKNLNLEQYINSFEWVPNWLNNHFIKILEKMLPIFAVCLIISFFVFFQKNKLEKIQNSSNNKNFIILIVLTLIGVIIWFLNAPIFRYGAFYLVSLISLVFIFLYQKKIYTVNINSFKKLKVIFLISIVFFVSKNIERQLNSKNNLFPVTSFEIDKYQKIQNSQLIILKPKNNTIGVCYLSPLICSHEVDKSIKFKKNKNYFFLKR